MTAPVTKKSTTGSRDIGTNPIRESTHNIVAQMISINAPVRTIRSKGYAQLGKVHSKYSRSEDPWNDGRLSELGKAVPAWDARAGLRGRSIDCLD